MTNTNEELWMEVHNIVQEVVLIINPKEKCKKAKWLSEEALQRAGHDWATNTLGCWIINKRAYFLKPVSCLAV